MKVSSYGSTQGSNDASGDSADWQELEKKTGMNIMKMGEKWSKELAKDCGADCFELDQDDDKNSG